MASENCASKLHHLLDPAFTSSASLSKWLQPGNEIHLARLCIILNLEAAERALHIANSTFEKSFPKSTHVETNVSPLQGFRRGQENAKAILDTLKYVRATLEKGVILARSNVNIPRSDVSALELFQSYVSDCINFWMSDHGIYDPSQIRSFLLKVVEFYNSHPEFFAEGLDTQSDDEVKTLRTLLDSFRKEKFTVNSNEDAKLIESDANKSSSVGPVPQQHQGYHDPLHIRSTIHHLVSSMDIRNYVYHVKLPSIFHHEQPQALVPPEGLNLEGLTDATELAFHLIVTWCNHHLQSPSSPAILSKLSSDMIVYVRAIDLSIGSAKCIFNLAEDALGLFGGLSKKTNPDDVAEYLSGMLRIAAQGLEESRCSLDLFKGVRKAVNKLLQDTNQLCEEEKTAIQERIFELERTKDVLEHFLNNIELYVGWWTRMNMTLSCQENSSKQLIKYYCSTRKEQIMTQWIDLRTSFAQYADKTRRLQDTFPDLFERSRQLVT